MTSAQICIMIAIIVYLIGMIYIGFRCSKKNNSTDDFYLGGRKLGPFVTAMSAEASDMSSWLLMGLPGVAYLTGISDAGWTAIGLAAGTYINWLIVAKRIRRYTHTCNNSITIPSFFSNRYRDEKKMLHVQAVGAAVQPGSAEPGAGAQLRAVLRAVRQAAVRILLHRNSRRI